MRIQSVPDPTGGLIQILREACATRGDRPWLTTPRESRTPAELWHEALGVAYGLRAAGVRSGDRVAIALGNGVQFLQAWFGTLAVGGTAVAINTGFLADEAAYVLRHCAAKAVVVDAATAPVIAAARASAPGLELVVGADGAAGPAPSADLRLSDLAGGPQLPEHEVHHAMTDEIAGVLYTSGTTGPPKGCMLGHDYHRIAAGAVVRHLNLDDSDVMLCVLPLFHMNAQTSSVTGSLLSGARLVLEDRFSVRRFWDVVRTHGVTEVNYLGIVSAALLKQPASPADRDHRLRVGFGAGMPQALHAEFERRFGFPMIEVFGMTETGLDMAVPLTGERRVGSGTMGPPVPGRSARLVADDGTLAPSGVPGHLQLRGVGLFRGYLDDPVATAEAFDGEWFRTGDVAVCDADGWYRYLDRSKDILRRAGENISSVEVESVLSSHPAVREAAVIGVEEQVVGQEVKAIVVLQPGQAGSAQILDDILRHCSERLAAFKVPLYIQALPELPRTASQKISKAQLRAGHGTAEGSYRREWRPVRTSRPQ